MNISEEFNEKKYLKVNNFLSKENCQELTEYLKKESETNGHFDVQCPKSKSIYDNPIFDDLLHQLLPDIENITGKKLYPTYSYARLYVPGEELKLHLDRDACEISATLTLGFDGDVWPIYMGYPSETKTENLRYDEDNIPVFIRDANKIDMEIGDAVVYKGCEMFHWREKYTEGNWQAQVFLHYVDANGPHKEWKNDKKDTKNELTKEIDDLFFWVYNDVLNSEDCDSIVRNLENIEGHIGNIGDSSDNVNKEIRNVTKIDLPTYKGIGAILTAVGIDANTQRWNFDIKGSNQCEFLRYPSGEGRYKGHIDTAMSMRLKNTEICRKLTVLAFLNDDYKGGKFFFQLDSEKNYPPQKKGTVIVFPSFLLHGVEDVLEGERYTIVSWLVGPWFK